MQNQFDPRTNTTGFGPAVSVGVPRAARDAGLRSYMLSVYNYMASGVLLTGIVALLFAMSVGQERMKTSTLQALFWTFATLMGLSMSSIFLRYTGVSIAQTFFAVS